MSINNAEIKLSSGNVGFENFEELIFLLHLSVDSYSGAVTFVGRPG